MKVDIRSSQDSSNHDPHQERVRKHLSVNFLVYRNMISKHLLDNPRNKITQDALKEMHRDFATYWHDMFDPVVAEGMMGSTADEEFIKAAVGRYSGDLADQINKVSDKAFIEGFNAAVNKGWDRAVAWERIATTYGLDPAQMRSWVMYYPEGGYEPEELPKKAKEQSERMLYERANRISTHEAWSLKQLGKQAEWTQKIMKGDLPVGTKKIWVTARDELVCPVCAPMDNIVVGVTEQFKTSTGKFFAPPVHINCRCEIYLQFDAVSKAMGTDRWNRDVRGRFSHIEQRTGNPRIKVRGIGQRLQPEIKPTEGFARLRGQDTTGQIQTKTKTEAKPAVKTEKKVEQKREPKIERNTDIKLGKRPAVQSKQNVDHRVKVDAEEQWVYTPKILGLEDIPEQGDMLRISQSDVLKGRDVSDVELLLEEEFGNYPRAHFYLLDHGRDNYHRANLGIADIDQPTTYMVAETMLLNEGDQISPDLARQFGIASGEGVSHTRTEEPDDERSYYIAPKDMHISRLRPFIEIDSSSAGK